jgi:hypothetical protein
MVDRGDHHGYEWTADRRARLLDVLGAIVDGIEGGMFAAVPGEWSSWRNTNEECTYCAFDRVCPRDRGEHADAKAASAPLRLRDRLVWEGRA